MLKISPNERGLYVFDVDVHGKRKQRTLKGLIDTGSTDCACTYKVITTLQIKPIDFIMVKTIVSTKGPMFAYEANVGFGPRMERVKIIRVPEIVEGMDFILGASFLSFCKITTEQNSLVIDWL